MYDGHLKHIYRVIQARFDDLIEMDKLQIELVMGPFGVKAFNAGSSMTWKPRSVVTAGARFEQANRNSWLSNEMKRKHELLRQKVQLYFIVCCTSYLVESRVSLMGCLLSQDWTKRGFVTSSDLYVKLVALQPDIETEN